MMRVRSRNIAGLSEIERGALAALTALVREDVMKPSYACRVCLAVLPSLPPGHKCKKCGGRTWVKGKGWGNKPSSHLAGPWSTSQGILALLALNRLDPNPKRLLSTITETSGPLEWLLAIQRKKSPNKGGWAIEEMSADCDIRATCWATMALVATLRMRSTLELTRRREKELRDAAHEALKWLLKHVAVTANETYPATLVIRTLVSLIESPHLDFEVESVQRVISVVESRLDFLLGSFKEGWMFGNSEDTDTHPVLSCHALLAATYVLSCSNGAVKDSQALLQLSQQVFDRAKTAILKFVLESKEFPICKTPVENWLIATTPAKPEYTAHNTLGWIALALTEIPQTLDTLARLRDAIIEILSLQANGLFKASQSASPTIYATHDMIVAFERFMRSFSTSWDAICEALDELEIRTQVLPQQAFSYINKMHEVRLASFKVFGGYARWDPFARNRLQDIYVEVFESCRRRKQDEGDNYLLWGPPGSGKTYFIEEMSESIKAKLGDDFHFSMHNLSREAEEDVRKDLEQALGETKSVLFFVDELTARTGGNAPYRYLIGYMDKAKIRKTPFVFLCADSLGGSSKGLISAIREEREGRGEDFLTRTTHRFEMPPVVWQDRIIVFLCHLGMCPTAGGARVRKVEKSALYYIALDTSRQTLREISDWARDTLKRITSEVEDRVRFEDLFERRSERVEEETKLDSAAALRASFVMLVD